MWMSISVVLLIVIMVMAIAIRNLVKQVESLEDYNVQVVERLLDIQNGIITTIRSMRDIDLRGAFESTDEVGAVFKTMLGMVSSLSTFLEDLNDESNR